MKKFAFLRAFGVLLAILMFLTSFVIAGGNPWSLVVVSEWIVVLGVTWFALLATYRMDFLRFSGNAVLALFFQVQPNVRYAEIAETGIRYARGTVPLGITMGVIITMGSLDGPIKELGHHIASALTVIPIAVVLSEFYFPFLVKVYTPQRDSSQIYGIKSALFGICVTALPVLLPLLVITIAMLPDIFKEDEKHHEEAKYPFATSFQIPDMRVNVRGSNFKYEVKASFEILGSVSVLNEMSERKSEVYQIVGQVLGSKRLEDLDAVDIRSQLKKDIMTLLNSNLKKSEITNIFIPELIVQPNGLPDPENNKR